MPVYYFGCIREAGHYMWKQNGSKDWNFLDTNPWKYEIDSGLCPTGGRYEVQGEAAIHHKDGWMALSFWDRSVDKRGKCNSNFLAEGTHSFDEMIELAKLAFPQVLARLTFPIVLVIPETEERSTK